MAAILYRRRTDRGVTVDISQREGVECLIGEALGGYPIHGREPPRHDMFAGFDNLDTTNAEFIGELDRVKPESVRDLEAGLAAYARHPGEAMELLSAPPE